MIAGILNSGLLVFGFYCLEALMLALPLMLNGTPGVWGKLLLRG